MSNEDERNPRKTALTYIEILGEIDKTEDQLLKLKKEATNLKKQLDDFREQRKNDRNKNMGSDD